MTEKLDDFLIGPQSDELEPDGLPENFDSDDIVREEYDRRMREKVDNFHYQRIDELHHQWADEMHRQRSDERIRKGIESRKLPDVSDILDTNQSDFDYGE